MSQPSIPEKSSFVRSETIEQTQAKTLETLTSLDRATDIMTELTETECHEISLFESMIGLIPVLNDKGEPVLENGKPKLEMAYPIYHLDRYIKKMKINNVSKNRLGRKEVVDVTKAPYQSEVEDRGIMKRLGRLIGQ